MDISVTAAADAGDIAHLDSTSFRGAGSRTLFLLFFVSKSNFWTEGGARGKVNY